MPDIVDHAGANRTARAHRQLRENLGLTRGQMRAAKKQAALEAARAKIQEQWMKRDVERTPHVGYVLPTNRFVVKATLAPLASPVVLRETPSVEAIYRVSPGPKRPKDGRVSKRTEPVAPNSCVECGTNPLRRFQRCQTTTHNAVETRPLIQTYDMEPSREVIRDMPSFPLKGAKPSKDFNERYPRKLHGS